jgi:hypothetical protein
VNLAAVTVFASATDVPQIDRRSSRQSRPMSRRLIEVSSSSPEAGSHDASAAACNPTPTADYNSTRSRSGGRPSSLELATRIRRSASAGAGPSAAPGLGDGKYRFTGTSPCRRRDSNPRHADHDSVRFPSVYGRFGQFWTADWTVLSRHGTCTKCGSGNAPSRVLFHGTERATLSKARTSAKRSKCASLCSTASPPWSAAAAAIRASVTGTRW